MRWCASSNSAACWPRPEHAGGYNAAHPGDVGEWFNPAVLKTADPQGSVSSNLTVSARNLGNMRPPGRFFVSTPLLTPTENRCSFPWGNKASYLLY